MLYLIYYDASSTVGWGKHKVYIMADDLYEVNRYGSSVREVDGDCPTRICDYGSIYFETDEFKNLGHAKMRAEAVKTRMSLMRGEVW